MKMIIPLINIRILKKKNISNFKKIRFKFKKKNKKVYMKWIAFAVGKKLGIKKKKIKFKIEI
jgi:hypothetical protein